jgi:tetratricopeptide (TPR) repeat protein
MTAVIFLTPLGTRLLSTIDVSPAQSVNDPGSLQLEPSAAARLTLYGIALQMLRERPALGYGPDNFVIGVPRYRPDPAPYQVRANVASSAHSWLAQTAATTGILGLAAFVAIALGAVVVLARSEFSPLALASATALGAFLGTGLTSVSEVGTDWLFWVSVGAIAAVTARPLALVAEPSRHTPRARRSRRQSTIANTSVRQRTALAFVALGAAIAILSFNALGASRWNRDAAGQRLASATSQAIELAARATASDPRRAEYWYGLGLAYVASGKYADASAALDRASKLAPYEVRYIGDLARAQILLAGNGDSAARANAIRLGDLAVQVDPNNPRSHLTRAVVRGSVNDFTEAVTSIQRAINLDPGSSDTELYVTATQILSLSGRPNDAVDIARRGLAVLGQSRSSVAVRVELAHALVAGGRLAEALAEIDLAVAISPKDAPALRLQAEIHQATAVAPNARIVAAAATVKAGSEIAVMWSGIPVPTRADWVGLFTVSSPDATYVAWRFTTGTPDGSVTLLVPASAAPGTYNLRLFLNFRNTNVAISPTITVN